MADVFGIQAMEGELYCTSRLGDGRWQTCGLSGKFEKSISRSHHKSLSLEHSTGGQIYHNIMRALLRCTRAMLVQIWFAKCGAGLTTKTESRYRLPMLDFLAALVWQLYDCTSRPVTQARVRRKRHMCPSEDNYFSCKRCKRFNSNPCWRLQGEGLHVKPNLMHQV